MKQTQKKEKQSGSQAFEAYYSDLFGNRWDKLKSSFFAEKQAVEYFIPGSEKSYFLDSASVLAALCLPLKGAERILDMCAAPGGKTLVLASRMDDDARLSANERSSDRKHRLDSVVETCLPAHISERITTSCSDAATWCTRQTECFDRILLDAPCSSERHVIADEKYLNNWSTSRIKTVTTEQWSLLSCAYRLLEPDGILLYSTCALCPLENDGMIERLFKKFNREGKSFSLLDPLFDVNEISAFTNISLPDFEKTQYGFQILPDKEAGAGPIYFSIIKKHESLV
ncbi:MAG: RsmB/NOP family class I SAM-dependent RNA methyltransferase [Treponema sp.]|nr:RsmB/NOP family class I SAM-dependent RNA methyltransferase [Treponema sp.]